MGDREARRATIGWSLAPVAALDLSARIAQNSGAGAIYLTLERHAVILRSSRMATPGQARDRRPVRRDAQLLLDIRMPGSDRLADQAADTHEVDSVIARTLDDRCQRHHSRAEWCHDLPPDHAVNANFPRQWNACPINHAGSPSDPVRRSGSLRSRRPSSAAIVNDR